MRGSNTGAIHNPYVGSVAEWVWLWDRFTLCGMIVGSSLDQGGCIYVHSPTFDIHTLVSLQFHDLLNIR